jgi:hypothetical protein
MTVETPAVSLASSHHRYALILPGSWVSLPMDDADALKERVREVVRDRTPRDDRFATARRNLRDELLSSATNARVAGARLYALSMELLPGLPFPASLIAYDVDWPPSAPVVEDPAVRLAAAFPEFADVATAPVPTRRRSSVRTRTLGEGEGAAETTVLDLTYWFAGPGEGLVCVMVSVPDCPGVEPITELFDMIASSIHWAIPAEEAS